MTKENGVTPAQEQAIAELRKGYSEMFESRAAYYAELDVLKAKFNYNPERMRAANADFDALSQKYASMFEQQREYYRKFDEIVNPK